MMMIISLNDGHSLMMTLIRDFVIVLLLLLAMMHGY